MGFAGAIAINTPIFSLAEPISGGTDNVLSPHAGSMSQPVTQDSFFFSGRLEGGPQGGGSGSEALDTFSPKTLVTIKFDSAVMRYYA